MLKNEILQNVDLAGEKQKVIQLLPRELRKYAEPDNEITEITYPASKFPQKVSSLSFDKQPQINGILTGIKGQYLIFDNQLALNIRKHNGYYIKLNV